MTLPQAVLVYVVCWWLLFFIALPIGVVYSDQKHPAQSTGAPEKRYMLAKFLCVTLAAFLATGAIDLIVDSGIVQVR
jgi:predicted secreted protein